MTDRSNSSNNIGSSASENTSLALEVKQQQDVSETPRQVVQLPFGLEGKFTVKPAFLQVVRKIKGVDPSKTVFTYKEVSNIHTLIMIMTN